MNRKRTHLRHTMTTLMWLAWGLFHTAFFVPMKSIGDKVIPNVYPSICVCLRVSTRTPPLFLSVSEKVLKPIQVQSRVSIFSKFPGINWFASHWPILAHFVTRNNRKFEKMSGFWQFTEWVAWYYQALWAAVLKIFLSWALSAQCNFWNVVCCLIRSAHSKIIWFCKMSTHFVPLGFKNEERY